MFDGQMNNIRGADRPHVPFPACESWAPDDLPLGLAVDRSERQRRHDLPLSEPISRLLHALAVYQVTRSEFGERVGQMGTLH